MSAATPVLWHIELSHFNEKARWALDYKGIPHRRRAPMPGFTGPVSLALTRGKSRRMPVLQLDGRTVHDSTAILAAVESFRPDPPLYPAGAAERARALEIEDWFDENLAPQLRLWVWHQTLDDGEATIEAVLPTASRARRELMRRTMPIGRKFVRADFKVNDEAAPKALAGIHAAMDRLESEIQPSGYLVGDSFSVADLSAAALFTPVILPPERPYPPHGVVPRVQELSDELSARRGGQWVFEMYAKHRGVSAEVRPSETRHPVARGA